MSGIGHYTMPSLPAAPLLTALRHREIVAPPFTGLQRAVVRARKTGRVSIYQADQLAVRLLKLHPALLWPEWFDLASAA